MKKAIVTGAFGYLGSKLSEYLFETYSGIEIIAIDDLSSNEARLFARDGQDLKNASPRFHFINDDILLLDLKPHFENADAVFHLAAVTDPSISHENESRVYQVNTDGARRVAEACARAGSILIFPSTTSVYAKQNGIILEEASDRDLGPQTSYADSKIKAELAIRHLAADAGLRYCILRLGTLFGVSQSMHFRTAVQKFCLEAARTGRVSVWESALDQLRPYCDIQDAARALSFCAEEKSLEGSTVHACTDHASVRMLIELLKQHFPCLSVDLVQHRAMNHFSYEVDCQRLESAGFEFKGSLKNGVNEVLRHIQQDVQCLEAN